MKKHKFNYKFWDNDNSVYFAFAITMAYFSTKRFSFGLEIAGVRVVYFEYKRLAKKINPPPSHDSTFCEWGCE